MVNKIEFDNAAAIVRQDLMAYLPKMIAYKSNIQQTVLLVATPDEIEDVRCLTLNHSLVNKLAKLANGVWQATPDATSLYCAAMAVGTIIKEYEWGTQFLTPDGLFQMSQLIQNAN